MSGPFDPRLTPARPGLAAAYLEGQVKADRFVTGTRRMISVEAADVRRSPRPDAPVDTQALHGEALTVYDEDEGWAWVQLETDHYTGYLPLHATGAPGAPAHVVTVNRTFVYPAPDLKQPVMMALPLGAKISVVGTSGVYSRLAPAGFVFTAHVAPFADHAGDFTGIAERLLLTPYLWGGKTSQGIDCSGLVQVSLARAGVNVPRDTDQQEKSIGTALPLDQGIPPLQRGDLVFWRGHVGVMCDATIMLHANAHHMFVAKEPIAEAAARILSSSQARITSIRRLNGQ